MSQLVLGSGGKRIDGDGRQCHTVSAGTAITIDLQKRNDADTADENAASPAEEVETIPAAPIQVGGRQALDAGGAASFTFTPVAGERCEIEVTFKATGGLKAQRLRLRWR